MQKQMKKMEELREHSEVVTSRFLNKDLFGQRNPEMIEKDLEKLKNSSQRKVRALEALTIPRTPKLNSSSWR